MRYFVPRANIFREESGAHHFKEIYTSNIRQISYMMLLTDVTCLHFFEVARSSCPKYSISKKYEIACDGLRYSINNSQMVLL